VAGAGGFDFGLHGADSDVDQSGVIPVHHVAPTVREFGRTVVGNETLLREHAKWSSVQQQEPKSKTT
jgi:hypothetical protein